MRSKFLNKVSAIATVLILGVASSAAAQDNPLLQPSEPNPLLQQSVPSAESVFEAQARAIDLAATKHASDPVCQNIRTNYNQQLAEIQAKYETPDGVFLSQINQRSSTAQNVISRTNQINRNLGGSSSGTLNKAYGSAAKGTAIVNDAAAIGGLLGIGGKKSKQKKAAKKAAKLDAQAMDAVKQTSCPMATFN